MDRWQFIENLEYLRLSETTIQAAVAAFDRHKKHYHNLAATAYMGDWATFPIRKARPLERIVIWGILLSEVKQRYVDRGIPESVIQDTFDDFALLAGIYEKQNGKPGLTQGDVSRFAGGCSYRRPCDQHPYSGRCGYVGFCNYKCP